MKFVDILKSTQPSLKKKLNTFLKTKGYNPIKKYGYLYAKGEIPVMVVAHMDTVHDESVKDICYSETGIIMSPQGIGGDDRCGIYIITRLIESGFKPYVLFTEDEEVGGVGASFFAYDNIKPEVNFIVEFDRKGDKDAVFYSCRNKKFVSFIESFGFKKNIGTFSDISIIAPEIGVAAVNLSSGYYNAHTKNEYIDMNDVEYVISRAERILSNCDTKYDYEESDENSKKYYDFYDADYAVCEYCGNEVFEDDLIYVGDEEGWMCKSCYTMYGGEIEDNY